MQVTASLETLGQFGADPDSVRIFAEDGPDLLPYATLTAARRMGDQDIDTLSVSMSGKMRR